MFVEDRDASWTNNPKQGIHASLLLGNLSKHARQHNYIKICIRKGQIRGIADGIPDIPQACSFSLRRAFASISG